MSKNNKKSDIRQISSLIKRGQELIRCGEREEGTAVLCQDHRRFDPFQTKLPEAGADYFR